MTIGLKPVVVDVLLSKYINVALISISSIFNCELLVLELHLNKVLIRLCLAYRPPDTSLLETEDFCHTVSKHIEPAKTILLGNFNFPDIQWASLIGFTPASIYFLDFCLKQNFIQLTSEATRGTNILDLCLVNSSALVSTCQVEEGLSDSDHSFVSFLISCMKPSTQPQIIRDFFADFVKLNQAISEINWPAFFSQSFTLSDKYNLLVGKIQELLNSYVPLKYVKAAEIKHKYPPCLKATISKKLTIWKKLRFNHDKYADEYKAISKDVKAKLQVFHNQKEAELVSKDPTQLHHFIKQKIKGNPSIPALFLNGKFISGEAEKCELLANTFSISFSQPAALIYPYIPLKTPLSLSDIEISVPIVSQFLRKLPSRNSTTPDYIPAILLKNCYLSLAFPIADLFRISLDSAQLPDIWKISFVLPIFKKDNPSSPINYRPISLTCMLCRVLERIIAKEITKFLDINNLISPSQFGFLKHRSTTTQLLACLESWHDSFYKK